MSNSPPVLPATTVENRVADDTKVDVPTSESSTTIGGNGHETEKAAGGMVAEEDQIGREEYPKGLQFIFILLALILSIFMVALDLVRLAPLSLIKRQALNPMYRLSSQRPFPKSRMTFTAFPKLDGTAPPSF